MNDFGKSLKSQRKSKSLTQEDLADRLGMSSRQISRWETGKNTPSAETLDRICLILECSPTDIMGDEYTPFSITQKPKKQRYEIIPGGLADTFLKFSDGIHMVTGHKINWDVPPEEY